jgi:hypothetical protein
MDVGTRGATLAVIAALAALAVAVPSPPPAHAAKGMEMALADDGVLLYQGYYNRDKALKQIAALHVSRLRVTLPWAAALGEKQARKKKKPKKLKYFFIKWDSIIDEAAAYGIRVQLTIADKAPAFATSNHKIGAMRPDAHLYGNFTKAVAQHFKGRVNRYSIWNEGNWDSHLQPLDKSAAIYRKLYLAGYAAIKKVDPKAAVLIGETAPHKTSGRSIGPIEWLRKVACVNSSYHLDKSCAKGTKLHADGYAHHPYDFENPPTARPPGPNDISIGALSRLTTLLDRLRSAKALYWNGGKAMPVYLTEFGYFSSGRRKIPESRYAKYITQAYDIARKNSRVKQMLQWVLVNPPKDFPGSFFDTGIVGRSGKTKKPYKALKAWADKQLKKGGIARPPKHLHPPLAHARPSGNMR